MAVVSSTTKGKAGLKAASVAIKNPALFRGAAKASRPLGKAGFKAAKPVVKRRASQWAEGVAETARAVGETARVLGETALVLGEMLVTYGIPAAYEFGLLEAPKPKRTAPRVAVGIVIGAGAMYLLEPEHGREHREKVVQLVS